MKKKKKGEKELQGGNEMFWGSHGCSATDLTNKLDREGFTISCHHYMWKYIPTFNSRLLLFWIKSCFHWLQILIFFFHHRNWKWLYCTYELLSWLIDKPVPTQNKHRDRKRYIYYRVSLLGHTNEMKFSLLFSHQSRTELKATTVLCYTMYNYIHINSVCTYGPFFDTSPSSV